MLALGAAAATRPAGHARAVARCYRRAGGLPFPLKSGSVRFLVLGDTGRGDRGQYETAQQMIAARQKFPYEFAILLGDNMYGSDGAQDYVKKFETPYKPLLDAGIKFYGALGNHDNPNQSLVQALQHERRSGTTRSARPRAGCRS